MYRLSSRIKSRKSKALYILLTYSGFDLAKSFSGRAGFLFALCNVWEENPHLPIMQVRIKAHGISLDNLFHPLSDIDSIQIASLSYLSSRRTIKIYGIADARLASSHPFAASIVFTSWKKLTLRLQIADRAGRCAS